MPDEENVTPIGQRLGSERLYDERLPPPPQNLTPISPPVAPKRLGRTPKGKPRSQPPQATGERPTPATRPDVNWRNTTSSLMELLGVALITVGCGMIAFWLAFVVGGALLVVLGVATGRNVTT